MIYSKDSRRYLLREILMIVHLNILLVILQKFFYVVHFENEKPFARRLLGFSQVFATALTFRHKFTVRKSLAKQKLLYGLCVVRNCSFWR